VYSSDRDPQRKPPDSLKNPLRTVSLQESAPSPVIQDLYRKAVRFGRSVWSVEWFRPRRAIIQQATVAELKKILAADRTHLWVQRPYLNRHAVVEYALQAARPDREGGDGKTIRRAGITALDSSGRPEVFLAQPGFPVGLVQPYIAPLCQSAGYDPDRITFRLWSAICLLAYAETQFEMIRHLPLISEVQMDVGSQNLTIPLTVPQTEAAAMLKLQRQMVALTDPGAASPKTPGRRKGATSLEMEYLRAIDDGNNDDELRQAIEGLPKFVEKKASLDRKEAAARATLREVETKARAGKPYQLNYRRAYDRTMRDLEKERAELEEAKREKFRDIRRRN
jgi:hypothetical protein